MGSRGLWEEKTIASKDSFESDFLDVDMTNLSSGYEGTNEKSYIACLPYDCQHRDYNFYSSFQNPTVSWKGNAITCERPFSWDRCNTAMRIINPKKPLPTDFQKLSLSEQMRYSRNSSFGELRPHSSIPNVTCSSQPYNQIRCEWKFPSGTVPVTGHKMHLFHRTRMLTLDPTTDIVGHGTFFHVKMCKVQGILADSDPSNPWTVIPGVEENTPIHDILKKCWDDRNCMAFGWKDGAAGTGQWVWMRHGGQFMQSLLEHRQQPWRYAGSPPNPRVNMLEYAQGNSNRGEPKHGFFFRNYLLSATFVWPRVTGTFSNSPSPSVPSSPGPSPGPSPSDSPPSKRKEKGKDNNWLLYVGIALTLCICCSVIMVLIIASRS